ncbi:alpha/beta hydrolase [Aromatoleum petrolei]|uniref:Alpha/beta fold hydrolase n=1 Tax=Aromatoleum petrolei TaxID=76116 RepID=A0ABX1MPV0_9RHOO|nr:alpha/beta fold hydrolase [Aromatoleum petrolei]NMF89978.1 alpha/beta fold hydrolase [Aromatoleum petrolei]QTQ36389.1 Putative alpha/beta hydrolase [Aromatoleum petrolei]
MNANRFGDLEVLACSPSGKPAFSTPLLFIHGAYTGAWCWAEHFLPYFADAGYTCYAVSLSGHGGSRRHAALDTLSIDDYVRDVAEVVSRLPAAPVLIGHSMGGMVVQKYLERAGVPAAVLLCSVPPQGLMGSAIGLMFNKPNLIHDLNSMLNGGHPAPESLREALFHQPVDDAALMRYYRLCQPESHRAIWDMTLFNLPQPARMHRPPMLILGAEHDHLIPPAQVSMTAAMYGEPAHIFPGLGHGVMLERDWRPVADHIAAWLPTQIV